MMYRENKYHYRLKLSSQGTDDNEPDVLYKTDFPIQIGETIVFDEGGVGGRARTSLRVTAIVRNLMRFNKAPYLAEPAEVELLVYGECIVSNR